MIVVTFTFRDDGPAAVQAARSVDKCGLRHYVVEDAAAPLAREDREAIGNQGAVVLMSTYARGGNLNGEANLVGQMQTFAAVASMHQADTGKPVGWVIKLDSDTVLRRVDWLAAADPALEAAVAFQCGGNWFAGPCYAVAAQWLDRMDAYLRAGAPELAPLQAKRYPEDVTTAWLAAAVAGAAGVRTIQGWPAGDGFAGWQYKPDVRPDDYWRYAAVSFGNRQQLPPQMPVAVKRLEAARAMARFLENAPFSRL